MNKLLPALLTILMAALLSIDFAGTIDRLYLLALLVVPGFIILSFALYCTFAVLTKNPWSFPAKSFLILFLASLLFFAVEFPICHLVRNHTTYNHASAIVQDTFSNKDKFEFTIVAIGSGAKTNFSLVSGYTNISINGNYYDGPSFDFTLNPKLKIYHAGRYVDASEPNVIELFSSLGMQDIATIEYVSKFRSHLLELSSTNHLAAHGSSTPKIELVPYSNTVYRLMFIGVSISSLLFAWVVRDMPLSARLKE